MRAERKQDGAVSKRFHCGTPSKFFAAQRLLLEAKLSAQPTDEVQSKLLRIYEKLPPEQAGATPGQLRCPAPLKGGDLYVPCNGATLKHTDKWEYINWLIV